MTRDRDLDPASSASSEQARALWRQVESLWSQAVDLPARERDRFVDAIADPEVRRELASMLAHAGEGPLGAGSVILEGASDDDDPLVGARLGPYRVLEQIGLGGMGVVYRAERTDDAFDKEVAIKVLRSGSDPVRVARFREERQILADIEHPKIARLLDGGTTEQGVPYVVMEYVRGLPITEYCRRRNLGIKARVRLFLQLCEAVDEAHRHLVVHRDIKPSNVLVTDDGALKLLDFGVAKLLDLDAHTSRVETATRERGLTPGYASPEQLAGGTITTASDLYSLGIVLFELLAGCRPHELGAGSPVELLKRAGAESLPLPLPSVAARRSHSSWAPDRGWRAARQLRGDLDKIVGKATRVDAGERYRSAAALALDLNRHLAGHPVSARHPSGLYRLGKLVRRHPVMVPLTSCLVVAIVALAVFATLLAQRAVRDRDEALVQRSQAEEVARFLEDTFRAPDPNAEAGKQIRAPELVDRETERVLRGFPERPDLKARLLNTLGVVYQNLGQYEKARGNFDRALQIRTEALGPRHLDVSETQTDLAWLLTVLGDYEEALSLIDQAIAIQRERGVEESALHALSLERRGFVLLGSGRFDEAERAQRSALGLRRQLFGDDHAMVGKSWQSLAESVGHQGRPHEAIEMANRAIRSARQQDGDDSLALAEALFIRGDQRYSLSDYLGAIEDYTQSLSIHRRRLSESHPSIGILLNNRARAFRHHRDLERAELDYRAALEIVRNGLRGEHREVATVSMNLSQVLRERGRYDEALALATEAETLFGRLLGADHIGVGFGAKARAAVLRDSGQLEAAVLAYERAREIIERGPVRIKVARVLVGLGLTMLEQGRFPDGDRLLLQALEIVASVEDLGVTQHASFQCQVGDGKRIQGRWEEAEAWYRRALDSMPQVPEALITRVKIERRLAAALLELGRLSEAAQVVTTALDRLRSLRHDEHWQIIEVEVLQAAIAAARGQPTMSKDAVLTALERYRQERGLGSPATRELLLLVIRCLDARYPVEAANQRQALRSLDARRASRNRRPHAANSQ